MTDFVTDFDLLLHVDNALAGKNLILAADHVGVVSGDLEVNAYRGVDSSPYSKYVEVRKAGELLSTFHNSELDNIFFDIANSTIQASFTVSPLQALPSLIEEGDAAHPNLSIRIMYEGPDGPVDLLPHSITPTEEKATPRETGYDMLVEDIS